MIHLDEKSGNSKRSIPFRYWEVKKPKKPKNTYFNKRVKGLASAGIMGWGRDYCFSI